MTPHGGCATAAAAWLLQVSCCGLEELLQLFKKHHAATSKWLGPGWKDLSQMQPLLDLPPGKRFSRQHMPEVGAGPPGPLLSMNALPQG